MFRRSTTEDSDFVAGFIFGLYTGIIVSALVVVTYKGNNQS